MSRNARTETATRPEHSFALALWCGCHGVIFTWVGIELPVTRHTPLPLVLTALALTHFASSVGSLARTRHLPRLTAALAAVSAFTGVYLLFAIGATTLRMLQDFGALGVGLAAALGAIALLAVATTAPFPLWWLSRRRKLGSNA